MYLLQKLTYCCAQKGPPLVVLLQRGPNETGGIWVLKSILNSNNSILGTSANMYYKKTKNKKKADYFLKTKCGTFSDNLSKSRGT